MAGTINYLYDPAQVVWVIASCTTDVTAVREGTVKRVRGTVITATTVEYDIQLTGENGTTSFVEADVFADLASAVAEYETRLTV